MRVRSPLALLVPVVIGLAPSPSSAQDGRGAAWLFKAGGTSESWVRRSGLDGDWLGLSRGVSLGVGVRVPVLYPQVGLRLGVEGSLGSTLHQRSYVGTTTCAGRCDPPGYMVDDLGVSANAVTASALLSVRALSLGVADFYVLGGVAARRTGFDSGAESATSALGGVTWGWSGGFRLERQVGRRVGVGLELLQFTEHRGPLDDDPRLQAPFRAGAWSDQALSLVVRIRPGRDR